jgi:hypothetical protein
VQNQVMIVFGCAHVVFWLPTWNRRLLIGRDR